MAYEHRGIIIMAFVEFEGAHKSGKVAVDMDRVPAPVQFEAAKRGLADKIRDLGAGAYIRSERGTDAKPGDKLFDTHADRVEYLKGKADELTARWYDGEWSLPGGGGAGDPVLTEAWAMIRAAAISAGLDVKGIHKGTMADAVFRIMKNTNPGKHTDKKLTAAAVVKVDALLARAAETVANRRMDFAVEI